MSRRVLVVLVALPWLFGGDCTFGQDGRTTRLDSAVAARAGGTLFAAVISDSVQFGGGGRPRQVFVARLDGCTETRLLSIESPVSSNWVDPETVVAGPRPFVITLTLGSDPVAVGLDGVPLDPVFTTAQDVVALGGRYAALDLSGLRGLAVDGTTAWSYPFPPVTVPGCTAGAPYAVRMCAAPGGGRVAAVVRSQLAGCAQVVHVHVVDDAGGLVRDVPLPQAGTVEGPCAIGDDGSVVVTTGDGATGMTRRIAIDPAGATRELAPVDGAIQTLAVAGSTVAGLIVKRHSCGSDAICYEDRVELWDRDGNVVVTRGAGTPLGETGSAILTSSGTALILLYEHDYKNATWNATTWDATGVQLCNADLDFEPYIE